MATSDSTSTLSPSSKKENLVPSQSKLAELNESRSELLSRIQGLKQDLQNWRTKLDTQVKSYRNELTELRKSLHVEVDQLRSEFQDLRTTLQQQQEDVTASLRNLGLQDAPKDAGASPAHEVDGENNNVEVNRCEISNPETNAEESMVEGNDTKAQISSTENSGKESDH